MVRAGPPFPDASIPVVQLSIDGDKPLDHHLQLGVKLAPLRASGVLVMASGKVVHNLRGADRTRPDEGFDWALRFDDAAREHMLSSPTELARLDAHADYDKAVPTPDHFIPALYLAGLAGAAGDDDTTVLVDGCAYGSLSMTAYTLGMSCDTDEQSPGAAAQLPAGVLTDAANI